MGMQVNPPEVIYHKSYLRKMVHIWLDGRQIHITVPNNTVWLWIDEYLSVCVSSDKPVYKEVFDHHRGDSLGSRWECKYYDRIGKLSSEPTLKLEDRIWQV